VDAEVQLVAARSALDTLRSIVAILASLVVKNKMDRAQEASGMIVLGRHRPLTA
jgi:hypothetical protein